MLLRRSLIVVAHILACAICWPTLAADGLPGADGADITSLGSDASGSRGQNATAPTGNGGDGGNGGDITIVDAHPQAASDQVFVWSLGGQGGNGVGSGNGGNGGDAGDIYFSDVANSTPAQGVYIDAQGGYGGNGGPTGLGGNGGNGGDVLAVIQGDYSDGYGQVFVLSTGGGAGYNACNNCNVTYGTPGEAGNVKLDFSGKAKELSVYSSGSAGMTGGGNIDLTMRGTANLVAIYNSGSGPNAGDVQVTLQNGAVVTGAISVYQAETADLTFAFEVASQAEVDAVAAQIAALAPQVASSPNTIRTISVGAHSYTFDGFTSLTNALRVIAAQHPGEPIAVTFSDVASVGDTFTPATGRLPTGPNNAARPFASLLDLFRPSSKIKLDEVSGAPSVTGKLRCDDRAVTVLTLSDGSLSINIRLNDGKAYAVGTVNEGKFKRAPGSRWTAAIEDNGLVVSERRGDIVANCRLN